MIVPMIMIVFMIVKVSMIMVVIVIVIVIVGMRVHALRRDGSAYFFGFPCRGRGSAAGRRGLLLLQVGALHGDSARARTWRTTAMAAPKPLSILTTVTPAAQL